ncbi:MAG: sensor histidine kinase [Christensenella sp.]|nr:sensor histidine kinase [Christensenella sp.]
MKKARASKKISTLIILYFSLFMVAILVFMSAIAYYYSYENMKTRSIDDTKVILSQVGKNIGRYIANAEDITGFINANTEFIWSLGDTTSATENKIQNTKQSYERFLKDIPKIGDGIVSIFIFDEQNNPIYVPSGLFMKKGYDITTDKWYQNLLKTPLGECAITGTSVRTMTQQNNPWVISLARKILDEKGNAIGTQLLELNYAVIDEILESINLGKSGYVFIVDGNGDIVYHPQLQLIYSGLKSENIDAVLKTNTYALELPEDNKVYTISTIPGTDFDIVGVTMLNELVSTANEMNLIYVILALAMALLAFIGSVQLAKMITKPLVRLGSAVNEVEKGNWDANFNIKGTTEVETLGTSLSDMTTTVKQLMNQVKADQEQIRTSELKALQSQINPHFLYNTLDSIIWIAEDAGNKKIKEMTMALANYFRIVLSAGEDIIPVADEIEHVRSYLVIQKMRYETLDYEINVADDVLGLFMPKLLLQPIVENAIYHGIKNKPKGGKIIVSGFLRDEKLVFEIDDNGRGMRSFELENETLRSRPKKIRHGGVGINNIRERIHLYYGKEYGITIQSEFRKGTRVTITLPANDKL